MITEFQRLAETFNKVIDWVQNADVHIYEWSIKLLGWIYDTLTNVVLYTPLFLFDNSFVKNASVMFSIASVSIIVLMTIFESIMKMLRKKHTNFMTIIKRFPLAIGAAGFAPFLFENAFKFINQLTKGITSIGGVALSSTTFTDTFATGSVDVLILLLFDVVLLGLLIPILLQNGKRWWDLFSLACCTPLAFTAWIFDRHSHLHRQWWNTIKRLSVVQLVYAVFVMLLGLFIYSTRLLSPDAYLLKLLIVAGGLFRLANPPQIVLSYARGIGDTEGMLNDFRNTFKRVKDTVTFQNLSVVKSLKKHNENRKNNVASLRKKHGRRYVNDLL